MFFLLVYVIGVPHGADDLFDLGAEIGGGDDFDIGTEGEDLGDEFSVDLHVDGYRDYVILNGAFGYLWFISSP